MRIRECDKASLQPNQKADDEAKNKEGGIYDKYRLVLIAQLYPVVVAAK